MKTFETLKNKFDLEIFQKRYTNRKFKKCNNVKPKINCNQHLNVVRMIE